MSVCRRPIKGTKFWIIDRSFRRAADGVVERYRRVAQVQTRAAAEAEEQGIIRHWKEHGTIAALLHRDQPTSAEAETKPEPKKGASWEDAVRLFRLNELPLRKPSTRTGYEAILEGPHMRRWAKAELAVISRAAIKGWDVSLVKAGLEASTRRNHHIVLRAVLRSVGPDEEGEPGLYLEALPKFPPLPKVGRQAVKAASSEDVTKLLNEVDDEERRPVHSERRKKARLAFALGAVAGMRASEIRGLRRRDVDFKRNIITIRTGLCSGEESTPKSGHEREIPIAPALLPILKAACEGLTPDEYVATTYEGTPWSDSGIWQALVRACKRLKIDRARVHGLRHHFATALFGANVDARTVQDLLGHADLSTTQRYAHTNATRARAAVAVFACLALSLVGCNGNTTVIGSDVEPAERTFTKAAGTVYPGELVAVSSTCPDEMCIVSGGCSWGGKYNPIAPVASMPELIGDEHVTAWTCSGMLDEFAEGPSSITAFAVCTSCDGEEVLALAE
jgi:integrase